ncbi:spore germination protein [Clostridium sp.]|jgi:spore germination protein KA|uniref:spore germination protein n=1 Tax=Clostridium sp. TaxID=1506 RepID=UPI003EE82653
MSENSYSTQIDFITNEIGKKNPIIIKNFYLGITKPLNASIIYINGLSNKDIINRDILTPLMLHINETLDAKEDTPDYLAKKYIVMCNTLIENDINIVINSLKSGKSVILIENINSFIVIDTTAGNYRSISDPPIESPVRGSREGFIENLETNISMLRRNIKDKNLSIENFKVGRRSQTDLALMYIDDIVDKDVLSEVRTRITAIDVDSIIDSGQIEQYIEDSPLCIFPQVFGTESPSIVKGNLMEGRIAIILNGTPFVLTVPAVFVEFFQAPDDYNERTIISTFSRILRCIAVFTVITLPAIYLTLIQFNAELIPVKFINPIVNSREGIALTPFLELMAMELVVEFLREGGLRLPPKIATTLSIVGGIIVGNSAIESKVVSNTTLLIVGVAVISTFLIPNYEMALSIRFVRFPMLFLANSIGFLGIAAGWFVLLIQLFSLESFGVPYFSLYQKDMKDIFIRAPLWKMNDRPEAIPNNNAVRQSDFRTKWWRKK